SGLPAESFLFLGFLPRRPAGRRQALAAVAELPYTLVVYEAPHRLLALLADVEASLGPRQLCVARELTKLHEEIWRGTPAEAQAHFGGGRVRGEITLVIAGASAGAGRWDEAAVRVALEKELAAGLSPKEAAGQVAGRAGWRRRDVYALTLRPGER
ncbi:MAG: 16S rRNA (cytidine(1402)-2'-O)-methyltransferase, partial [Candidatus Promineifilaceae bacterium]